MFFKELRLLDIVFLPFESKNRYGNLQVLPGRHATPCPARGVIQIYMEVKCIGKVKFGNQS